MPSATTDIWWAALEKSNLLSPEQLADARRDVAESGADSDAKTVAERLVKRGLITRWQADQLLAGKTNLFLGRYKLEKRIGKGGMGAVYKAHHTVMGRAVALKVMAPSLLSDATAVARFRREVEAAAKLNHPNIVSAYDADCVGKTHFLVMEYIDGPDLKHWFDRHRPLPIPWVCECIRQAAVGLQHAHEHGMVHRDLKPSNLLVTSSKPNGPPIIKILDMGLARFISTVKDDEGLTQSGQIMGTPDYIAPEQAEDTKRADIRSDIFSLGCTLFYLLTGELPFRGESIMAKLMARIQTVAPPIRSLRSEIPLELDAAIAKMLALDPAARQQTPAEVAAALAPFAADVSAGTAETISLSAPAEIPTLTSSARPDADTGYSEFLANLANRPNTGTRHGGRTIGTRVASGEQKGEGSGSNAGRIPRLTIILAAAAVGILLLIASVAFVLKNRDRGATAKNEPIKPTEGESVSSVTAAAEKTKTPSVPTPDFPSLEDAANKKAVLENPPSSPDELKPNELAKPAADPGTSDASKPASPNTSASPNSPSPSRSPQTLFVGVAEGQLPDLKAAFEKAGPGDTILIRHRGPLEFSPLDLSGKTPLTIVGDVDGGSNNGTDYWPIVRQAPVDPNAKDSNDKEPNERRKTELPGLFYAKQLEVTFRKLHLVAAGPNRAGIGAVFGFAGGRVELDHCTVTVGVQGSPGELPGAPLPLVRTNSEANGPIALVLNNSFLRGLRLQTCVSAEGAKQIDIQASQSIWAGGSAPWIIAKDTQGPVTLALRNCTIYNVPSFLNWESHDETSVTKSTVDAQAEKCLFVGPYANKEPFVAWNPGDPKSDLPRAVANGTIRWQGSSNVFHRYSSFYSGPDPRKPPALDDWRKLWNQSGPSMARQADPIFRVWPDGYELQETLARDFQPRFSRTKSRGPSIEVGIGADHNQLPYALVNILNRPLPAPEMAAKPRGVPRVLRVHQKDGPHKTLESAFAAAQDRDIIEIASDGPFMPTRDFGQPQSALASGETAVIPVSVPELSLRATDDARPVIILDERKQKALGRRSLILFYVSGAQSFSVEGIHFHLIQAKDNNAGIAFEFENKFSRWTNCSFVQVNDGVQSIYNWVVAHPRFHAQFSTSVVWLENNSYNANFGHDANLGAQGVDWLLIRNCLSVGPFLALSTYSQGVKQSDLVLSDCSVFGQSLYLNLFNPTDTLRIRSRRNLVVQTAGGTFVSLEPSSSLSRINCDGSDNCISWSDRIVSAAERDKGPNALLPGSALTSLPLPEGSATARDLYRPFRLKKGQPVSTMAPDGGPLGVRYEYLPDLPPQLPTILQAR